MVTEDYTDYKETKVSNRENEMRKTLISVRISTLTDEDKMKQLISLKRMIDEQINDLSKLILLKK